jgi:multidrug efflux pump subunit AcrB
VFEVGFSSPTRSPVDLRNWVDLKLRPQLLTIEGVASVDIAGGLVREIRVTLDQERLRSYGLAVADVLGALRDENQDVAVGNVTSATLEVGGKTQGKFRTVDDVRGVLLQARSSNQRIPLSEVATVADTSREQRLWARLDGVPAVGCRSASSRMRTPCSSRGRAHRLEQLAQSRFIPAISSTSALQQAFFINAAVQSVRMRRSWARPRDAVRPAVPRSLRKTIIIGLAIPLAVLATFVMMGLGHHTLNIMSLGGLALGVGMLVDNAIVMIENIFRHTKLYGGHTEDAAHSGSAEVTSAVVASTMTHLAAVVPFLLITGLAALIFRELVLTISFAIAASLATALTLVPMLAAQLGKVRRSSGVERSGPCGRSGGASNG